MDILLFILTLLIAVIGIFVYLAFVIRLFREDEIDRKILMRGVRGGIRTILILSLFWFLVFSFLSQ